MKVFCVCILKHERYSRLFRGKYFLLNFKLHYKTKEEMNKRLRASRKREILKLVCYFTGGKNPKLKIEIL